MLSVHVPPHTSHTIRLLLEEKVHRTDIMEGFRRNLRHIARIDAIIAGLLINALFTGIAIDLMLSHGQNENNMKEITGVINE